MRILRVTVCSVCAMAVCLSMLGCSERTQAESTANAKKVIVIGFDGMDPRLCKRLMDEGELPVLAKMRDNGGFSPLQTSMPPQSPVAWSNFITGAGPGVHGIFDFIHRDPAKQCSPYYSAAKTIVGEDGWEVDQHKIPLEFWPFNHNPTQTLLQRHGTPFWDYLDEAKIPVRIYDIPSNYPPSESKHGHMCCLSGMGVPDLLGGYGSYQHFSEETQIFIDEDGGMRSRIVFDDNKATAKLFGPHHTYLTKPKRVETEFTVYRHPSEPTVRIDLQGQSILLREGEWSEWNKVDFELAMPSFLPNAHANGICRFYLQEVRPKFRLYVSPVNIDPSDTGGQKVSEPVDFVEQISKELGLFYTAGFQEDHKALSNGVFKDEEYLAQANYVLKERRNLLRYAKENFDDGFLFFYFSSTDLQAHMFWWDSDDPHPTRSPSEAKKYNAVIEDLYKSMDAVVGDFVREYGDDALIFVMSDHGFSNFARQFNLNTWLRDNGYIEPINCQSLIGTQPGATPDWERTRAYSLGLNGLYVNQLGRERDGIVPPSEKDELLNDLTRKLLAIRDPRTGKPVIARVYRSDEIYAGPHVKDAPDLLIGYHRNYRASWASVLGSIERNVLADNDSAWSADHCIAREEVPGVLFSNRRIEKVDPALIDLAPTILEEFGIPRPKSMTGRDVFDAKVTAR